MYILLKILLLFYCKLSEYFFPCLKYMIPVIGAILSPPFVKTDSLLYPGWETFENDCTQGEMDQKDQF